MEHYICVTCGTQFAATATTPAHCPICEDERQYIGHNGQQWTTLAQLRTTHKNQVREHEPQLVGIGTEPRFAIGQRALLVQSPGGNLLWDCITLIDDATFARVRALGGIRAIAISHPHYYSCMVEWSHAFDAPIYLHTAERPWVMRPDAAIEFWTGETMPLWDGMTLIRGGGHFEGGQMLHWPAGVTGKGALLTGDIIQVVSDRRWVSFMYSYPNLIPLSAAKVQHLADVVQPYAFDRIYGAWWETIVAQDAKAAVARSAQRYIGMIRDDRSTNQ
ncbi:MAG: hypothetical protein R3C14_14145 [Caldilineaceae bacterium]